MVIVDKKNSIISQIFMKALATLFSIYKSLVNNGTAQRIAAINVTISMVSM